MTLPAFGDELRFAVRRPHFFAACAVFACAVWALCAFPVLPLQDFNEWTYQGYLLKNLWLHAQTPVYVKPWPVPNSMTQAVLALLMFCFSPITASKVFVFLYLACATWLLADASRHDGKIEWSRFILLSAICIFHAPFWTGELNYQLGLLVFFAYVHRTIRNPNLAPPAVVGYSIVLFFCHALCLGMFLVYEVIRAAKRRKLIAFAAGMVPVAALLIWYKLCDPRTDVASLETMPHLRGIFDWLSYQAYQAAKMGPYHNFVYGGLTDFHRNKALYLAGAGLNFVFVAGLAVLVVKRMKQCLSERDLSAVLLASAAFLIIGLFNLGSLLGIANAGERMLAPGVLLAVYAMPPADRFVRGSAWIATTSAIVFAVFALNGPRYPLTSPVMSNSVVSNQRERLHVLFWHKPFVFAGQAEEAERSASTGTPPRNGLVFETSVLLDAPHGPNGATAR
jgi:hypothetical protein